MKKISGIIIASIIFVIFAFQAGNVLAKHGDDDNKPISGPITSPITGPMCKPGWGFGDDNHCHFGPPGQQKKDDDGNNHEDSNNHGNNNKQGKDD